MKNDVAEMRPQLSLNALSQRIQLPDGLRFIEVQFDLDGALRAAPLRINISYIFERMIILHKGIHDLQLIGWVALRLPRTDLAMPVRAVETMTTSRTTRLLRR